ncbi:MAG: hypothetical protein ACREU2_11365 [Steroidobacteraceae bacterium]
MIDPLLEQLAEAAPDHALDGLEVDIWAGVAARERARGITRIVVALQALVLVLGLLGSLIAGQRWGAANGMADFNPFSPQWTLVASSRLLGAPK